MKLYTCRLHEVLMKNTIFKSLDEHIPELFALEFLVNAVTGVLLVTFGDKALV